MKYIAALICLLLSSIATSALAIQGNDCATRSEKVKPAERDAFMKTCMAQVSSPSNVKEIEQKNKSTLCEQNAKNKKLQGSDKSNYHTNCMNKNEAVVAANNPPKTISLGGDKSASNDKPKSAPHKAAEKSTPHKATAKKPKQHKKSSKKVEQ